MHDPSRLPDVPETAEHGSTPGNSGRSPTGFLRIRCPECQTPTDFPAESSLGHVSCGYCGLRLRLVDETTSNQPELTHIGHFELIEKVGEGGFGTVWKAIDHELDRDVAIKLPRRGNADPAEGGQFLREARAAASLHHPHIVAVHEIGRIGDRIFIVSDFVKGCSLETWLSTHRMSDREAAQLCATVAAALDHAHQKNVVHRDLKPGNILLDEHHTPFVTDFGLARRDGTDTTVTTTGKILGTPAYMSPEQARGESHQADRRSDIYSLGVILYELLAGRPPFQGSPREVLRQVEKADPPSLQRQTNDVPRDLETICRKCLEKDPDHHYQSAEELKRDLDRFLAGQAISARRSNPLERAARWCRGHAGVTALGAILFGVLLSVLGFAAWRSHVSDQARFATEAADETLRQTRQSEILANQRAAASEDELKKWEASSQSAMKLIDLGRVRAKDKSWDDAAAAFSQAIDACPKLAFAWEERGALYLNLALIDLAAADIQRAFELSPPTADRDALRHLLLRLHVNDLSGFEHSMERLAPATSAADSPAIEFARLLPDLPRAETDTARLAALAERWRRDGHAHGFEHLIALAYLRANRPEDAIATCRESDANSQSTIRQFGLPVSAMAHHRLGQSDAAKTAMEAAVAAHDSWLTQMVRHEDTHWEIHYGALGEWPVDVVGWLAFQLTYHEARRSLGLAPAPEPQLSILRARAFAGLRRQDKAIPEFDAALRLLRRDEGLQLELHRVRGLMYVGVQQYTAAAAEYARATELSPHDHYLWRCRTVAHLACGDMDKFRAACRELISRFGDSKEPLVAETVIGCCILDAQTVEDWNSLKPIAEVAAKYYYGSYFDRYVHYRAKNYQKALEGSWNADDLVAINRFFLAMTHFRLGNMEEAQRQFAQGEAWVAEADRTYRAGTVPPPNSRSHWAAWTDRPRTLAIEREARELLANGGEVPPP